MATIKEIMGELKRGDGRKVTSHEWSDGEWFEPIFFAEGEWHGIDEKGQLVSFLDDFEVDLKILKKTKKIKMYSPIIDGYEKNYCSQGEWHTDKTNWAKKPEIKGWLEFECEVEE